MQRFHDDPSGLMPLERDACAIIAYLNKAGQGTHGNVQRTIDALIKMGHRAGEINGEGDGCGILTDLPRKLWAEALSTSGQDAHLSEHPGFGVAHLLIPKEVLQENPDIRLDLMARIEAAGVKVLLERPCPVRSDVLSSMARRTEPLVWQLALLAGDARQAHRAFYRLQVEIERETPVHVASLSGEAASYKVHGAPEILPRYYPELKRRDFVSAITIGHSRYSTNTLPTVLRAQPFSLLGHNGEINTIARLREEARMAGIHLPAGGSDSQDLNRTLEGLMHRLGVGLPTAMEMVFPPIDTEVEQMPSDLRELYSFFRRYFTASAQGPAGIIARAGQRCVISVDAMGLRPLWFGETHKEYFASSELGVLPQEELVCDPKPLAPGEKIAFNIQRGKQTRVLSHREIREEALRSIRKRLDPAAFAAQVTPAEALPQAPPSDFIKPAQAAMLRENLLAALAWKSSDSANLMEMARTGQDPIGALGYDGPLAALAQKRQNLSDYFKEQVAVVTNPAIDRERESEHFSTRVHLGSRPSNRRMEQCAVRLEVPLLPGGGRNSEPAPLQGVAGAQGTTALESLLAHFRSRNLRSVHRLSCVLKQRESLEQALARIAEEAVSAVKRGAQLLLLDDSEAFGPGRDFLDPFLCLAVLHKRLKETRNAQGESLRRQTSLVLRSGALRNLHDLIFALGMGAEALCPYLMWELASEQEGGIEKLLPVLRKGLEKVISTMGTHEIGGYGKYFASIGLSPELAEIFETPNFCGGAQGGLSLARLEVNQRERREVARLQEKQPPVPAFRLFPRIWKMIGQVAKMEESYADYSRLLQKLEEENPLAIRHLLDFRFTDELSVDPQEVDTRVGEHDLPILISAMSFGSQGETPYRIYAEAAKRLNIICMNGEGGEMKSLLGLYRKNRGQQVASGRFGVNMDLLNSADVLEIKVGQGAKPGEGGHLPGYKVTAKIAAARSATEGVTLISPSNNHDIYSIEDLAQIIEELRTANPRARISVKVPAVAGIGTIAMGIAKAGANIITVSGYDGGTGAARKHAIKYVGLPAEIGVREAHKALLTAGLRDKVELWADGGARSGRDAVKLMLLGANRVGFGTLPMIIIGCTTCRGCHLGTCHVGIATQIETQQEAAAKGLKRFVPRVLEHGIIYETTFFRALGEEIRILTAKLGLRRTQDLVGRADLLRQIRGQQQLDLSDMLNPVPLESIPAPEGKVRILRKPLNYLTSLISLQVMQAFAEGEDRVRYDDHSVSSSDRAIGTYLAGAMTRGLTEDRMTEGKEVMLHFRRDSIPGNGLAAFNIPRINMRIVGGAQDGVGKCVRGGKIVILKGENREGHKVGGSVGKGLAYGAQGGTFLIQGSADSRACIRLSGADVVIGGRIREPLDDSRGEIAARANLKGFAFEYMTAGRVVVLGDPGPWICSGMTGGTVYCHLDPEMGMDREALKRRLARGAGVAIRELEEADLASIEELLMLYLRELVHSNQEEEAAWVESVLAHCRTRFVKIVPEQTHIKPRRVME